jgi:fibronectin type 3 domain-containing protein
MAFLLLLVMLSAPPQTAHSVSLSWNPVTTYASGVPIAEPVLYNVFRAENKSRDFQRINSAHVKGTSYTDDTVQAGNTYHYKVKSWTATQGGSAYSNGVSAFVP